MQFDLCHQTTQRTIFEEMTLKDSLKTQGFFQWQNVVPVRDYRVLIPVMNYPVKIADIIQWLKEPNKEKLKRTNVASPASEGQKKFLEVFSNK